MAKESQAARKARKALAKRIEHRAAGDNVARLADVWTKRRNHKAGFAHNRKNAKPGNVTIKTGAHHVCS